MTTLGEVIERAALERGRADGQLVALSSREISRRSAEYMANGRRVHHSTIANYREGRGYDDVRDDRIHAIAHVLATEEHSYTELVAEMLVAAGVAPAGSVWIPPRAAHTLRPSQKRAIARIIYDLAAANRAVDNDIDDDTADPDASDSVVTPDDE